MLTTTYREDGQWSPRHVSELLQNVRHWLARRGHRLRYAWVLELTKRGRPHYHVLVWLPRGLTLPKPDKQGWWRWGMTRIEWVKRAVGYAAKYASKGETGALPKGARLYGCGGHTGQALREFRWWKLPVWLRDQVTPDDRCRPMRGGGWVSMASGEVYASLWRVIFDRGRVYLVPR